jgi:ATP-dependent exoDNAse (exonuclease V) alpha subunit
MDKATTSPESNLNDESPSPQPKSLSALGAQSPILNSSNYPTTSPTTGPESSFANLMKAMNNLAIAEPAEVQETQVVHLEGNDAQVTAAPEVAKHNAEYLANRGAIAHNSVTHEVDEPASLYKSIPFTSLDPSQQHAVNSIVNQKYSLLIGYAGTGKSTTVDNVIKKLESQNVIGEARIGKLKKLPEDAVGLSLIPKIAFCSYTGRATQQLRNKLPDHYAKDNCMTVHKLLGYYPEYFEEWCNESNEMKSKRVFIPYFGNTGPLLSYDVIVIDEAGMLPAKLWNELLAALPDTCRLILAGDSAQLPPIHGVSPLGLLLSYWPTYELTKIHRTDNTELVDTAQLIRQGKTFPTEGNSVRSMLLDKYPQMAYKQVLAAVKKLFEDGDFDPEQDIVVTTTNVGLLGQENLNKTLRKICNPNSTPVIINAVRERKKLAIGDKVMSVSNDYELGITNGMFGVIVDIVANPKYRGGSKLDMSDILSIDFSLENTPMNKEDKLAVSEQASHICIVHFPESFADDKYVEFSTSGGYSNFQLAYACTCHKVQGGEYRNVMIVCHRDKAGRLLNREWLYTAWTRSKSNIFLLHTKAALSTALERQALKGRTLSDKAAWIRNKYAEKIAAGNDEHFPKSLRPMELQ